MQSLSLLDGQQISLQYLPKRMAILSGSNFCFPLFSLGSIVHVCNSTVEKSNDNRCVANRAGLLGM